MILARRLLLSLPLLLTLPLVSCTEDDGDRRPVRPPVVVDEATMVRLLAAMQELQDLTRAHPQTRAQGLEVMPMFLGITAFLGEPAGAVVQRHGFVNATDFESKFGYVQQALQQLQFQDRHGFDGDAQLFRLRGKLQELEARKQEIENDAELSAADRRLMLTEVRMQVESVEERIGEVNDFAATMAAGYENVPPENLASVKAHLEELIRLIDPSGTLTTTPPGG